MVGKQKKIKKKSESIKEKLNAMTDLNKKRKSALEKLSKSILEENEKEKNEKHH
jgi:hypothetical protein